MSSKSWFVRLLWLLLPGFGFSGPLCQEGRTIRVDVSMVVVPVLVTDKMGKHVPELTLADFRLFEDSKEQKIAELIPGSDPFQVALMIDSSGSTHFQLEEMQSAAIAFVDALKAQDRVMIVSFDSETRIDSALTSDRGQLREAIRRPHPEGAKTALYDAVVAVHQKLSLVPGRKAMVIFSDGVDNASLQADDTETLRLVEQSDVITYAVQYDTRQDLPTDRYHVAPPPGYPTFGELYRQGVKYLRRLTALSGGRVYDAGTPTALREAFQHVAGELQNQYTLCYYPAKERLDGSFHRITIKVNRPGVTVRARTGYRAQKRTAKQLAQSGQGPIGITITAPSKKPARASEPRPDLKRQIPSTDS